MQGEWKLVFRKEQVTISQLHIGHTKIMYSFMLKQEEPPQCI